MAALDANTVDDDYVDSFASLEHDNHLASIPDIHLNNTNTNNNTYKLTPIGQFVKSDSPPADLHDNDHTVENGSDDNINQTQELPSTSSQPNPQSFYYEKNSATRRKTPKFNNLNEEEELMMGEMIELDDVDLGSPPLKNGPFQSQLRMLDDHQTISTPTVDSSNDDKHKSVWSDLALQFLKGDMADEFLTFEDAEVSPEMLKLLHENKKTIDNRKLLWRLLSGGFLFSFLYALGGCFIFILFGFCFSLPCALQLWRIAKFLTYPYTKSETYFYLLCLINTDPKNTPSTSSTLDRRMSIASSMTTQTLDRKYSVTTVKEARQILFQEKENKGILLWIANIVWLCLFGWWIALLHLIFGGLMLASRVGADFGKRHLSLIKLALLPFGLSIKK
ncbi:predicted protein [Naegleria gruberi]|uniref:Predicted protein n=1 Tax=Naegleria gruberi TaxID=5762 RepID=D2VPT2_NAEGR|nr:uncharacterized protein NAEGRDRAFT_51302 [Naegleria gruberi]EFC41181.1 predicted protein [Naegleria gruberi]|eukprot:XP_002673925.1 predicted protein [Naegleria gruberi strain NEG-M]